MKNEKYYPILCAGTHLNSYLRYLYNVEKISEIRIDILEDENHHIKYKLHVKGSEDRIKELKIELLRLHH